MLKKILFATAFIFPLLAHGKEIAPCQAQTPIQSWCMIAIDQLRPTQTAVGMLRVEDTVQKLRGKDTAALQKYAKKKSIVAVIGPDSQFYLADRHHLARSLLELRLKEVPIKVIGKIDNPATFWHDMRQNNWAYPVDQYGHNIDPNTLPTTIAELKNDPYRSLSAYAQETGAYTKGQDAYFVEFAWSTYFGNAMQWRPIDRKNLAEAIHQAKKLACQPAAAALPGFKSNCH